MTTPRNPLFLCTLAALAGCGATAAPTPVPEATPGPVTTAPEPLAPSACLPIPAPPDVADWTPARARLEAGLVTFCRADPPACWSVDVATGALSDAPPPADLTPETAYEWTERSVRTTEDGKVEACPTAGGACILLDVPAGTTARGEISPDGKRAAAVVARDVADDAIQLFTLPGGKRGKRIPMVDDTFPCGEVAFLGDDRLLIGENICAGPAGWAWLSDLDGKRIAAVGGTSEFGTWALDRLPLGGDLWVFREDYATALVVQNVRSGEVVARTDLTGLWPIYEDAGDGSRLTDPEGGRLLGVHDGKVVLLLTAYRLGTIAVVDPATGALVHAWEPVRCPAGG